MRDAVLGALALSGALLVAIAAVWLARMAGAGQILALALGLAAWIITLIVEGVVLEDA